MQEEEKKKRDTTKEVKNQLLESKKIHFSRKKNLNKTKVKIKMMLIQIFTIKIIFSQR